VSLGIKKQKGSEIKKGASSWRPCGGRDGKSHNWGKKENVVQYCRPSNLWIVAVVCQEKERGLGKNKALGVGMKREGGE